MVLSFLLMALPSARSSARAAVPSPPAPRTVFLPSPANPLVAIRIFFQVGAVDDPKGRQGLASLTAEMVGQGGTKARTYAEVLDALYPLAANIRVYGDKESVVFEGMVHRDNLTAFADLIADQILTPRFAEDDFARNKQDALDYITKTLRGNADEELGKQAMATVLYRGHPYGYPSQGTVAGLTAITLDDVKQFYAKFYARDRMIIGVGGGYPEGFAEAFAKRFEVLPAKAPPLVKLPPPPKRRRNEVLVVEKEARANAISMGHSIKISRSDPDFYPLTVASSYLGEHRTFNGVMMNHLRGNRGLNYGDYSYVESFIQEGWSTFPLPNIPRRQQHFEIWLRPVPPQNRLFALRAALYETDKLIREGIPEEGFQATKTFLANYANLWAQDVSRRLGYAIDAAVYGKDVIAELKARLPKMKKGRRRSGHPEAPDHRQPSGRHRGRQGGRPSAKLVGGEPTPITYDTTGTPAEILVGGQDHREVPGTCDQGLDQRRAGRKDVRVATLGALPLYLNP